MKKLLLIILLILNSGILFAASENPNWQNAIPSIYQKNTSYGWQLDPMYGCYQTAFTIWDGSGGSTYFMLTPAANTRITVVGIFISTTTTAYSTVTVDGATNSITALVFNPAIVGTNKPFICHYPLAVNEVLRFTNSGLGTFALIQGYIIWRQD